MQLADRRLESYWYCPMLIGLVFIHNFFQFPRFGSSRQVGCYNLSLNLVERPKVLKVRFACALAKYVRHSMSCSLHFQFPFSSSSYLCFIDWLNPQSNHLMPHLRPLSSRICSFLCLSCLFWMRIIYTSACFFWFSRRIFSPLLQNFAHFSDMNLLR